jgi:hypothetical protein
MFSDEKNNLIESEGDKLFELLITYFCRFVQQPFHILIYYFLTSNCLKHVITYALKSFISSESLSIENSQELNSWIGSFKTA